MSLPAKRQHEETAAAAKVAEGSGSGAGKQQQHVGGGGGMVMESAAAFGSGAESRPAKVARHNDRGVEAGEKVELFGNSAHANSKPGRDGGGSVSVAMEVTVGEGSSGKEGQVQQPKPKVREFVFTSGEPGKSDREGRDPGRMDLERKASGGKEYGDAVAESSGNKELLIGKVDVKGEDQVQQHGGSAWKVGQELADSTRGEGNSEGLRKASPREGEGKVAVKREDVPMDVKREEPREKEKEKEKEKKDEKRIERKEDVLPVGLQQQQLLPQPHLDASIEKDNEKDEKERKKGEKEKERVWERERSRDREKEAVRSEKREKREKERDRDSHRREREDRDDGPIDKVEKEEGKGVKIEETDMVDRKPVREVDDRKLVEKEGRERVRERNRDKERDEEGEGEKRKKRVREQEKDRDSLNAIDTEGAPGDKDKDAVHGYGVQQRKRLLRPRGQSNPANRDSRSRFRPKDNEGTQGRSESSFINYRVGEGMPELAKIWEEYVSEGKNSSANGPRPTVEIRIPAELATTTNRQIRGSQLWGTDTYTDDSDIVAVLLHTGYYSPSAAPPPNSISELRATIQLFESKKHAVYTSTLRNGLRSRAWGGGSGCSYSVERCRIMKQGGGTVELEPCLNRTPQVSPTLAPAASERTITTRAASSSAYRQQRFMQEVTIQYNLCNEPWAKYSMGIVADRNLKNSQFTSARLKKGEVLYVETHAHRYELAYDGERTTCNGATTATSSFPQGTSGGEKAKEKWPSTEQAPVVSEKDPILHTHNGEKAHGNHPSNGHTVIHHNSEPHECYRWSKCKRPLPLSSMKKKGLPLPAEFIEVLEEGLQWEEVQWSTTSVWVRGTEYMLSRAQFFSFDKDDMEE